jgi:superfamily II DNA/RNA helicase
MNEDFSPMTEAAVNEALNHDAASAVESTDAAVEAHFEENMANVTVESSSVAAENVANDDAQELSNEPAEPNAFEAFGLSPSLVQAVAELGFTKPTPVQLKAIPLAMKSPDGNKKFVDLMVSSQTGSGKTAAYLLPVLNALEADMREQERLEALAWTEQVEAAKAAGQEAPKKSKRKDPTNMRNFRAATPGALVLCPTRELAQQVANDAIDLVRHMRGVRIASVIGGMPYQLQIAKLQNATLIVATPGRLLDLQRSGQIKCEAVKFLIVDEADRMLDLGFSDDLAEVNQLTIERRQTMMFSATFAPRIQQLAARVMREPQRITIESPQEGHQNIKQMLYWADNMSHKRKLLDHWMRDPSIEQAIIFSSTQVECDSLANELADAGFVAAALHGALSQGMRNRRLGMLREGRIQFLVATDVAARGIDVRSISHVFNYGLPMKAEDYTHRIGRTGRAGRDGTAVTIAEFRDRRKIQDIEFYNKQPLKAETIPGLEPMVRAPAPSRSFGGRERSFDRGGDRGDFRGGDRGGNFERRGGGIGGGGSEYAGRSGFNDRNSGGGFGGRTKSFSDGGWGGRQQQGDARGSEQRGFDNRGGDNRGPDQRGQQDQNQAGFPPRGEQRGFDNRGGERSFAPRAPFSPDRGQERGAQDRGQDRRSFDPRGDQRTDQRAEPRGDSRPFQRPERPERASYEPRNTGDAGAPKQRGNTWNSSPFEDKRPAKKPYSPGKTTGFVAKPKVKVVKVMGR